MAGADSFIQVAEDGTGKKMDTTLLTVAGEPVHRERVQISDKDDPDGHAKVVNATPGATDYGVVTRAAGTTPVSGSVSVSNFPVTQPVSVADGADVTQGAVADAESASGNGTVIALLKRLRTLLSGTLTVAGSLGRSWTLAFSTDSVTAITSEDGTWAYAAGVSGAVVIPAGGRVLGFAAHAGSGGATFTINGGATVTVPEFTSIDVAPKGNLVAPTFVFTGTDSYFVEYVS